MRTVETPLMKQFYSFKTKHPDAILLFRVGDFYETFEDDAVKASKILGITLTKRSNGTASFVDLAGFPYHALDTYLPKLVRAGQRVAICEQLEDPKLAKTIVKRGIVELVTPGISFNDNILEKKENNFLASIYIDKNIYGIAFLDISTGEFLATQGKEDFIDKLLQSLKPKEIIFEKQHKTIINDKFSNNYNFFGLDEWVFTEDNATNNLYSHFKINSLKGFGIQDMRAAIIASGAILDYLNITQHNQREHIKTISRIDETVYLWIDKYTAKNLELLYPLNENGKSLIEVIDNTLTPMGSRTLKRWVALPLKNIDDIDERLDIVEHLISNEELRNILVDKLQKINDLERLASKIAVRRINPRELVSLKNSLEAVSFIKTSGQSSNSLCFTKICYQLFDCKDIISLVEKSLNIDCPNIVNKGNVIARGYSSELDQLRDITTKGKEYLENLEKREIEKTGISSLKIGFNNVFGYYFEVRNTHKDKVPSEWTRRQTLVSAERYINEELKEYEDKILGAEEKILNLELNLYNELLDSVSAHISEVQENANHIARIDCLLSFANVSILNKYSRPLLNNSDIIDIKQGRHPVIEKQLSYGETYIANDVYLDDSTQQIMMITGPNMSGKSALLRQTALICIMAQIGCFVPAQSAQLGLIDKVFTRVGASDNISMGESTFMVEMLEAANIMNNLSHKSLILLDELGRGTSTYDGISIAWAIAEYIHEHPKAKAKTLFATHYHELNEMEKSFKRIKNYNVAVKETNDNVIFLRKLQAGGSEHSFGIHVAQMAGMPKSIIFRAKKILEQLEGNTKEITETTNLNKQIDKISKNREGYQLSFFQLDDPTLLNIRNELKNIDINTLTPLEALNKLSEIKKHSGIKD